MEPTHGNMKQKKNKATVTQRVFPGEKGTPLKISPPEHIIYVFLFGFSLWNTSHDALPAGNTTTIRQKIQTPKATMKWRIWLNQLKITVMFPPRIAQPGWTHTLPNSHLGCDSDRNSTNSTLQQSKSRIHTLLQIRGGTIATTALAIGRISPNKSKEKNLTEAYWRGITQNSILMPLHSTNTKCTINPALSSLCEISLAADHPRERSLFVRQPGSSFRVRNGFMLGLFSRYAARERERAKGIALLASTIFPHDGISEWEKMTVCLCSALMIPVRAVGWVAADA